MQIVTNYIMSCHVQFFQLVLVMLTLLIVCGWSRFGKSTAIGYGTVLFVTLLTGILHQLAFLPYFYTAWSFSAGSILFLVHALHLFRKESDNRSGNVDPPTSEMHLHARYSIQAYLVVMASILVLGIVASELFSWKDDIRSMFILSAWVLSVFIVYKCNPNPARRYLLLHASITVIVLGLNVVLFKRVDGSMRFYVNLHQMAVMLSLISLLGYAVTASKKRDQESLSTIITWLIIVSLLSQAVMLAGNYYYPVGPANVLFIGAIAGLVFSVKYARPLIAAGASFLIQVFLFLMYQSIKDGYLHSDDVPILIAVLMISSFLAGFAAYLTQRISKRKSERCSHCVDNGHVLPHGYILASRWKRLWGALLDSVFILFVTVPSMLLMGAYSQLADGEPLTFAQTLSWLAYGVLVFLVLNGWLLFHKGQTLGKRIVGTKIVDAKTGQHLSFGSVYGIRYLLVSGITQIPVIGHLFALVDVLFIFGERKRCIHDWFAGSIVIDVQQSAVIPPINEVKDIAEQSASVGQEAVSCTTEPDDEIDNARGDRQFQDIDALLSFVEQTKLDQADVCSFEQALDAAGSMWEGRDHAVCKDMAVLLATLRFYVQPEINQPGAIAIVGVAQGGQPGNPVDVTTMIAHASYCRVFRIWRVDDGSFIVKAAHEHLVSIDPAEPAIQGIGSGSYRLEWQEKRMEDGLIVAIPKGWEKTPSLNFVVAPSNSRRIYACGYDFISPSANAQLYQGNVDVTRDMIMSVSRTLLFERLDQAESISQEWLEWSDSFALLSWFEYNRDHYRFRSAKMDRFFPRDQVMVTAELAGEISDMKPFDRKDVEQFLKCFRIEYFE